MQLTIREVLESIPASQSVRQKELPVKTAYWLNKNLRKLESEGKSIDETRKSLFEKYAGEEKEIPEDKMPDATAEFDELLDTEIEVDIHKFKLEDFGDIKVTALEMNALGFMIDL